MVALEPPVVGQYLARRQAKSGAAQGARAPREHHRREADAIAPENPAQLRPVGLRGQEMAPVRHQPSNLFGHTAAQLGVSGGKGHHHRFGVLTQEPEDPSLEPLFHSAEPVPHRTAHAASGISAAVVVTGAYPHKSMALPKSGDTTACTAP